MRTLLVTNDFPPEVGVIQSYLFGLVADLDPRGVRFAMPVGTHWLGLEEGFGGVFAEAAAGLPAVEDARTGYLVDGRRMAEVQRAPVRLLGDEKLRERMGGAAEERALHGARPVGERYREVLGGAVGKESAAS